MASEKMDESFLQEDETDEPSSDDEEKDKSSSTRRKTRMERYKKEKKGKKTTKGKKRYDASSSDDDGGVVNRMKSSTPPASEEHVNGCPEDSDCRRSEKCTQEEEAEMLPEEDEEKLWEHDRQPPITGPLEVVYCPICGRPPDYCEFGEDWEKCRPWVMENFPHYYPDLLSEDMKALSLQTDGQEDSETKKKRRSSGVKKTQKQTVAQITIQKVSRAKRKTVTVVTGLDTFAINLDKAARLFSKHYSCGASAIKGTAGLSDKIDVQGDVEESIGDVIIKNFPEVSVDKIKYLKAK